MDRKRRNGDFGRCVLEARRGLGRYACLGEIPRFRYLVVI